MLSQKDFGLIVLDLLLPNGKGVEAITEIRKAMRCKKWDVPPCKEPCDCPFGGCDDDDLIDNDRYEDDHG